MKKVAIITVNYNGISDTLELLHSLNKLHRTGLMVKTIVVDNASDDNSVELISKQFPGVDLVQNGVNSGFSGGFNRGLEYAQAWGADYYLIINNDTLINSSNLLTQLIKTIETNSGAGIVAPKIYFAKGFEFYKDRYKEQDLGKVLWYAGGYFDWDNVRSIHRGLDEVDQGEYDQTEPTDFISGCCLMITREVLEKVGAFDNDLFAYYEDNDFLIRAAKAGFGKYYTGSVSIYHKVSQTAGIGSAISDYFSTRNQLIFGLRYAKIRTRLALIRQGIRLLLFGRRWQRQGVWDFLTNKRGSKPGLIKSNPKPIYPRQLSITIVNYNTADLTRKLLESIYDRKSGIGNISTEVILLDNGQLDPCQPFIKNFPQVKYIENTENQGFTKGYNRTIRYSSGEHVLLLNSDIEVLKDSLTKLMAASEKHQAEAITGGKLYFPNGSTQDSCFNLPTIWGAIKEYFLGQKGAYFMYVPKSTQPTKVEGLVMACFMIPRKILNKVGLLNEETFIFFEDIEYCRRLKKNNIPVFFHPEAEFVHHHGASTKKLKEGEAYKLLVKSAIHYHGRLYYSLLYLILWLAQKLSPVETPH